MADVWGWWEVGMAGRWDGGQVGMAMDYRKREVLLR